MELIAKTHRGVPLVEVHEDIDHSTAAEFHDAMRESMKVQGRVFLDITDCRYIDSGGLAVMLTLVKDVQPGGWLGVVGANRNISRLFSLVGLDAQPGFHHFPDLCSAERGLISETP